MAVVDGGVDACAAGADSGDALAGGGGGGGGDGGGGGGGDGGAGDLDMTSMQLLNVSQLVTIVPRDPPFCGTTSVDTEVQFAVMTLPGGQNGFAN